MASIGLLGLIASSADAKGSKRPAQPPLKNIATTANPKCDVKNIKFLEGMIKKGSAVKLQKKDLDSARYRYSIAKRALAEKEFALCIAAIKSSQRVLSNARPIPAKPTRGSTSYCTKQDMKTLAETIALGDKYMFPAKALFSAEAKLAKAKKASSSRQRRSCGWNVKTGIDALEPHRKALEAKKARIAAAVKACPKHKKGSRLYLKRKQCIRKAFGTNSATCTNADLKNLSDRISSGRKQKYGNAVLQSADKQLRIARKAKPARNWTACLRSLQSGNSILTNVAQKRALANKRAAGLGHAKKCHDVFHRNLVRLLKRHGKGLGVAPDVLKSAEIIEARRRGLVIGRFHKKCKTALNTTYSSAEMPHLVKIQKLKKTVAAKSSMQLKSNTDIPGRQFQSILLRGSKRNEMVANCSFMCQLDKRCKSFTFAEKRCYLKAFKGKGVAASGVTSGTKKLK